MRCISIYITLIFAALLSACEQAPAQPKALQYSAAPLVAAGPGYRFAIHPLYNPQKLSEAYQPLINLLNREIQGVHFELEASRDYQAYEQKFSVREPAFLLPNPWQTLQAIKAGYHVIAMAGDAPFAPHLLFPQFLEDADPIERGVGLRCALSLLARCDELHVFGDTISEGMAREIAAAKLRGVPVRSRP